MQGAARDSEELPSEEALEARCLELGLFMRRAGDGAVGHTVVTLHPLCMPRRALELLYARQLLWNEAVDRTARNFAFLQATLRETGASDVAFTGRLLRILDEVYVQPATGATHAVYQPLMLGIVRTDYMQSVDESSSSSNDDDEAVARCWKNVEINTVSCSFAGLAPQVVQLHRFVQQHRHATTRTLPSQPSLDNDNNSSSTGADTTTTTTTAAAAEVQTTRQHNNKGKDVVTWPEPTCSGEAVPAALATAVRAWHDSVASLTPLPSSSSHDNNNNTTTTTTRAQWLQSLLPIVLVVTQEHERNTADQYRLLFHLLDAHGVVSMRRTHAQLHDTMQLVDAVTSLAPHGHDTRTPAPPFAIVDGRYVVAVAYYRSSYVPSDYPNEACWRVRAALERSNAIKCPSVPYHLMTFKKLQQVMTRVDDVLCPISFAGDARKARALAQHFMPQYSLNAAEYDNNKNNKEEESSGTDDAAVTDPEVWVRAAVAQPEAYVLKPQLEGGGNLIAGETMQRLLATTAPGDALYSRIRKEYILMRRIHFPVTSNAFLRNGSVYPMPHNVCSELGIYGTFLSDGVHEPGTHGHTFTQHAGYVVRSKAANVDDGGVMAGVAGLDSVALTP